jgi:DNA-binding transcriptional regulator YhcF (GntR family)
MTSTRIEFAFNKISRISDLSDLAEMLFPGNRNQQRAFLVIWITLKWRGNTIVPNLAEVASEHGVSRRTVERVRAKMRRMGLIDHVSRFSTRHGGREGWVLSSRLERGLDQLSSKVARMKDVSDRSRDKEMLLLQLADARRGDVSRSCHVPSDSDNPPRKGDSVYHQALRA